MDIHDGAMAVLAEGERNTDGVGTCGDLGCGGEDEEEQVELEGDWGGACWVPDLGHGAFQEVELLG